MHTQHSAHGPIEKLFAATFRISRQPVVLKVAKSCAEYVATFALPCNHFEIANALAIIL